MSYRRVSQLQQYRMQGFILGLLPVTLLAAHAGNSLMPGVYAITAGVLSSLLMTGGVALLFRAPYTGKILASAGLLINLFLLFFELAENPLLTLFCALTFIAGVYYLFTAHLYTAEVMTKQLYLERFTGSSGALLLLTVLSPLFADDFKLFSIGCLVSFLIMFRMFFEYCRSCDYFQHRNLVVFLLFMISTAAAGAVYSSSTVLFAFFVSMPALFFAFKQKHSDMEYLNWVMKHPARCLVLTFLTLSGIGTILLRTPLAMARDLSVMEAAFTAVSGSCVTGLSIINIASDLTVSGRFFLLLLIQSGGLGIMTLAALALHALGRMSMNQEHLLVELNQSPEQNIVRSLGFIVRFTLIVESIGAVLLTWGFYTVHGDLSKAVELGIFTSISAFCNAGFFPGSSNLMPYAGEKLLLLVIAGEITLGSIAPAVTYSVLKFQSFRQLPLINRIVIISTLLLTLIGTFFLLLLEWNGLFATLSLPDKIVNAFFQAVTLRTAGFNSVYVNQMSIPTYLLMLFMMFVGGNPGGTAGGIKTTTLAVLVLTLRAAVRGDEQLTVDRHRVRNGDVIHAFAIFVAAILLLTAVFVMLVMTQTASAGKLLFETFSALGTVGLSMGLTGQLDSIGQFIIMAAMLAGRVGPLTLFLLLSENRQGKNPGYPEIKIPLG